MVKIDETFLLKLGMKELLLAKLNNEQKKHLIAYAMDQHGNKDVIRNLILLASMELSGKAGAILLAVENTATISQLKILDKSKIAQLAHEYSHHKDPTTIIKMIKEFIISEQQEKLYNKTRGIKGESSVFTRGF